MTDTKCHKCGSRRAGLIRDGEGPYICAECVFARVRELEGKLETARNDFQNIVEQWECRSELFPSDEQCAATLADFARKALEKIGGKG